MKSAVQSLSLNEGALQTVAEWQRGATSLEVCCFLAVDECGSQRLLRLTNHAALTNEFEVSQSEAEVVRTAAQQREWKILAFVHTHPHDAPDMSARDVGCFERDTLPWIIIGTPLSAPHQRTYWPAASWERQPTAGAVHFEGATFGTVSY